MLPEHIKEEYHAERAQLDATDRARRIRELQLIDEEIDALQRIDLSTPGGVEQARLHAESAAPELIQQTVHPSGPKKNGIIETSFDVDSFAKYRQRRATVESPRLAREISKLKAEHDAQLAGLEDPLDYYIRKIS